MIHAFTRKISGYTTRSNNHGRKIIRSNLNSIQFQLMSARTIEQSQKGQ